MRIKKRYLALVFDVEREVDESEAKRIIMSALLASLGEVGVAESEASLISFDQEHRLAILRCSTKALERVLAALALKRWHEGYGIALRLQAVSGTLRALREKIREKIKALEMHRVATASRVSSI